MSEEKMAVRASDGPIKITREIPLHWLIAILIAIVGWGISNYLGYQKWADATAQNIVETKKLSAQMTDKNIRDAEQDSQLKEHERRLNEIDRRPR